MKVIWSVLAIGALAATPAMAEWEKTVLKDETVTARVRIAENLAWVNSLTQTLVREELAAPSKMVITELQVRVEYAKWINDDTCSLPEPYSVRLESGSATFYFVDDPSDVTGLGVANGLIENPCQLGPRTTTKVMRHGRS